MKWKASKSEETGLPQIAHAVVADIFQENNRAVVQNISEGLDESSLLITVSRVSWLSWTVAQKENI